MGCKLWVCYSNGHWARAKAVYTAISTNRWLKGKMIWRYQSATRKWEPACSLDVPHFTLQPKAATVFVGSKATFTIRANGYESIYWEVRSTDTGPWVKRSGGLSITATGQGTSTYHTDFYRAVLVSPWGTVRSNEVTMVTNAQPLTIHGNPRPANVRFGQEFSFSVSGVTGPGKITFYWQWHAPGSSKWLTWGHQGQLHATGRADNHGMQGNEYRVFAYDSTGGHAVSDGASLHIS